jgi:hypothetical protein
MLYSNRFFLFHILLDWCHTTCFFQLKQALSTLKKNLRSSSMASEDAARTFLKLIEIVQDSSQKDIAEVLTDKKNKEIV